jgi:hypothetical protein
MKFQRKMPIRSHRAGAVAILFLALISVRCGADRLPAAPGAESARSDRTLPPPGFLMADPYSGRVRPIDGGRFLVDPSEDDELLDRGDDGDIEKFDIEFITVQTGGNVEVGDSHIEIPPFALSEDTWVALFVPPSGSIEYWAYPPDITFNLPVEIRFSYKHADSTGVNEQNITIDQWLPQFQIWDIIGGVVDTEKKRVTAEVMQFPPAVVDSIAEHARFALADHN